MAVSKGGGVFGVVFDFFFCLGLFFCFSFGVFSCVWYLFSPCIEPLVGGSAYLLD